jgi:hypothetical protein
VVGWFLFYLLFFLVLLGEENKLVVTAVLLAAGLVAFGPVFLLKAFQIRRSNYRVSCGAAAREMQAALSTELTPIPPEQLHPIAYRLGALFRRASGRR